MKVNGFKCDTCLKIWSQDLAREPLPMPWFKVQEGMGDEMHFCSLECLIGWASQQISGSKEYIGDEFGGLIEVNKPDIGGPVAEPVNLPLDSEYWRRFDERNKQQ